MSDTLMSINPADGTIIKTFIPDSEIAVSNILHKGAKAFKEWRGTPVQDRARLLSAIAVQLRTQKEELALTATQEMGKPIQQSREEVEKCAVAMDYYAQNGASFLEDEVIKTDAAKSYVRFQPLGLVLAIMPWNFPYWQAFRAIGPALMAGNTMVLKHASNVCGCAEAIEKVMKDAGAPEGVFQKALVSSSRIKELLEAKEVVAVTITGSTAAGKKVAATAGKLLKKQVMELGGSDAYIILADADIEQSAKTCVDGRLVNGGQSCVAAKRFVAVKEIRKEFEKEMTALMKDVVYGDPMNADTRIGPMARADLRDELHQQVIKSIEMGAKLLCGGFIPDDKGAYYPPTVLSKVKPGMPAYDEELFGPVAAIIEAKDDKDAIAIANDNIYGLGGGIFSKNIPYAEDIAANELEAGNCFVNTCVHSDPRLPFGGIKQSGYGRELSSFGIREFVNIKTVYVK